jgi:phospholipase D-like protein
MFRLSGDLDGIGNLGVREVPAWICSPYVTKGGLDWFEDHVGLGAPDDENVLGSTRLLTCLDASAIANGSLDLSCLWDLHARGVELRSLPKLHAKILIKGDAVAFGSANLTKGGVKTNREVVCRPVFPQFADQIRSLFKQYWQEATEFGEPEINQCAREAEFAKLELSDEGALTAQWNEQFVLVSSSIEILPSLRTLELPASALGYSPEDALRVARGIKMSLRDVGKDLAKGVRSACEASIGEMRAFLGGQLIHQSVLALAQWEEFDQSRSRLVRALRDELERVLPDQYGAVQSDAWARCRDAVLGYQKEAGVSLNQLNERLSVWFLGAFPSPEELIEGVDVRFSIRGISPLQLRTIPSLRNEILSYLGRPIQAKLF